MSSTAHRIGRDTLVYGIGIIIARIASVALLPIYTRYLSLADYGLLQLLELAAEVASILFVAGSRAGMMRFYYRTEDATERNTVVSSTFFLESTLAVVATISLLAAANPVWRAMLAGEGTVSLVRLSALNFLLGTLQNTPFTYLQTRQRAAAYTALVTGKLILQVVFNLYFLVKLRMGVEGMLLSGIIVNAIVSLILVTWMLLQTGVRLSWPIVRELRRFGVPYQLTSAGGFILTFGDRFFLQRYQGATQVGLYALAYQFGFLLAQLGAGPYLRAWLPERYKAHSLPRAERDAHTRKGFLLFNLILLSMAAGIGVSARPAIRVLTEESYHSASTLVPLILAAYVLHSWTDVMKFGIDVTERTLFFSYASLASTVVVLVAYALLIPPYGAMGAALATTIAFAVRFALTLRWAQQLAQADYDWPRIRPILYLASSAVSISLFMRPAALWIDILVCSGLLVLYALAVWSLTLRSDERSSVRSMVVEQVQRRSFRTSSAS